MTYKKYFLTLVNDGNSIEWRRTEYDPDYKALQKEVGGLFESVVFSERLEALGVDAWINEEGKLLELPATIPLIHDGQLYDFLCGNVCFIYGDNETGESDGLPSQMCNLVESIVKDYIDDNIPVLLDIIKQ